MDALHEDCAIDRLFPDALAKACNANIEKVNSLIDLKSKQGVIGGDKSKRELQLVDYMESCGKN